MTGMKSIEGAANEATLEALLIGHVLGWVKRLFDCIALRGAEYWVSREEKKGCTPARNGPFHRKARGPDPAPGCAVRKGGCLVFILTSHEDP